mgnify:CR=1
MPEYIDPQAEDPKSLRLRIQKLEERVGDLEEKLSCFVENVWWRRIWFCLDGWPLYYLIDRPQWRPWHQWTRTPRRIVQAKERRKAQGR